MYEKNFLNGLNMMYSGKQIELFLTRKMNYM